MDHHPRASNFTCTNDNTKNDDAETDYSANHYAKNDYYSSDQDDPTPELVSLLPPKNQTMKSDNLVLIGFGLYSDKIGFFLTIH